MSNETRRRSSVNGVLALVITAIIVAGVAVYLGLMGSSNPIDNPNPPPGLSERPGAPP